MINSQCSYFMARSSFCLVASILKYYFFTTKDNFIVLVIGTCQSLLIMVWGFFVIINFSNRFKIRRSQSFMVLYLTIHLNFQ